ncbi:efflux RND transporter permease subunit [Methanogenium organophilum]|uniref:Hydrophobe/amphiphile efflux-3 (HAE3) family transporter n=1 Tax=Methanogenium organophilum TaxID=2199 RepID=A0A9X9T9T1_METOG|nr:hydrophobe/amphiphile efflux-3 (HAE3) family transporter [Methanogenium organophilum]WAI02397.1 hydrophobe/amphiphile efflux-3 (HAE3) family transporter [Methanogenium organophilum]
MQSPFAFLANSIIRHPKTVAAVVFGVILVMIFFASGVQMKTGTETYVDITTPTGSLIKHYEDTYSSDSIILMFEGDAVYMPETLDYLRDLSNDIENEYQIVSVSSIIDLVDLYNGGIIPGSEAEIKSIVDQYKDVIPGASTTGTMTLMQVVVQPGLSDSAASAALSNIRSVVETHTPPPGISVTVTGTAAFSDEMQTSMGTSTGMLIGLAMLLMVVAMGLLFGHVRYRFLPVFIVLMGVVVSFGMMGASGTGLTMMVMAAFPVMIGIGIDYAIQFQTRFDEEVKKTSIDEAVYTTVTQSGSAVAIAMVATSLGFIALSTAPFPMVVDFGVICVVGVLSCYLCALVIVPTFAKLVNYRPLDPKPAKNGKGNKLSMMERYDIVLAKVAAWIADHPVGVLLLVGCVAMIGIPLDDKIVINTEEEAMVPPTMPAKVSMDKLGSAMGSTSTIPLVVRSDDIFEPATLQWMVDITDYEELKHSEITGATSIASVLTSLNGGTLPQDREQIDALLEQVPENTLTRYTDGQMEAVIEFSTVSLDLNSMKALLDNMRTDLEWYEKEPGTTAVFTGSMALFGDMIDGITESKSTMNMLGFGLIFVFLLLIYRKATAITPIIPIIMIVGWNAVIMYVLGLEYNLLTATLGAMTIGVASEYTILIMERYDEERERGLSCHDAIQVSIQKIGTAISISGLTTVFGFSALTLSEFPIMANFGLVTVITVAFSLVGAILVMPAVLAITSRIQDWFAARESVKRSKTV